MENNASTSYALDREVKKIQFRIQQEISLTDDEIQRMSEQLTEYKSEIVRKEKQFDQLQRTISEMNEKRLGIKNRNNVSNSIQIALMKHNHQIVLQNLREQQELEINQLQDNFESRLEQFEHASNARIEDAFIRVDKEIEDLRSKINLYSATLSRNNSRKKDPLKQETDNHCNTINNNLIIELRNIVQYKNQERAEILRDSKEKLTQCMAQIEDMEKEHEREVEDRRKSIEFIDKSYKREVNKMAQAQQHKLSMLKGHLLEAEKRTQILRIAAHKLELSNEQQLHETMKEIDMFRMPNNSEGIESLNAEKSKTDDLSYQRSTLQAKLREKELALDAVRAENSQLKKQIADCTHRIRFSVRRTQNFI